jgi:alpha-glucosidase
MTHTRPDLAPIPEADGEAPWWHTATIYEIYPRSFADHDGDGIGDLRGITDRLPYLSDTLGIDTIWICPFYPSPLVDFGYDVSDFTAVDPTLGTLDDFDTLIDRAHRRGLRVLIDYIPNHSSDQHPWFLDSRGSRNSSHRDWYVWAAPAPHGGPPSNWASEMGGSTWQYDQPTGQYYLHSFHREQPDLNWRNPRLRAAMLDVLRFWLDRRVDGVRIDVAHMIAKHPQFADNPPRPHPIRNITDRQHADFDTQQHLHDRLHPDLHGYLGDIRRVLDEYTARTGRARIALAEVEVMPWSAWSRFFGANGDGIHLPFNFQLIEAAWVPHELAAGIEAQEAALPPGAWPNYVLQNHDRPRLATRLGAEQVRNAAVLLLTARGTPTLYYGEELGLPDRPLDPARWQDPLGRDESRAPMPWSPNGPTTTWIPAYPNLDRVSVAAQLADPSSALNLYRDLLRLRRQHRALQVGAYQTVPDSPTDCLCYLRTTTTEAIYIALNLGPQQRTVTLPGRGRVLLTTDNPPGTTPIRDLHLPPHTGAVIELDQA